MVFANITIPQSTQTLILSILQMAEENLNEGGGIPHLDDERILAVEIYQSAPTTMQPLGETYISVIGTNDPDDETPVGVLAGTQVNLRYREDITQSLECMTNRHIDLVVLRALYLAATGQDVNHISLGLAREVAVTDNFDY